MDTSKQCAKKYKSVKIPVNILKKIKEVTRTYPNLQEAAEAVGIKSRQVLGNAINNGRCSSDTYNILLKAITKNN